MDMELIPEKINEGRLLSALSLEQRVLANGVLPNSPLTERVSLVKGIITGLLEQGKWAKAIQLLYNDGSPARVLFDDWEGLRKGILASVQKQHESHLIHKVADLLLKHGEEELLYGIARELPLGRDDMAYILDEIKQKIPPERLREGYNSLAAKEQQHGNFASAYEYYKLTQNTAAIDALYQHLLAVLSNIEPDDGFLLLSDDTVTPPLLEIAEETSTKENSRVEETVQAFLKMPHLLRLGKEIPQRLRGMVQRYQLAILPEQDELLKDALCSALSFHEVVKARGPVLDYYGRANCMEIEDAELALRWAKLHTEAEPQYAYEIFRKAGYSGAEVTAAVRQGLNNYEEKHNHYQGLNPGQIAEPHLRQVYDTLPLGSKGNVAVHLKDPALLRELSMEYAAQSRHQAVQGEKKDSAVSASTAYRLWIIGGGGQHEPYVKELRAVIMEQEIAKEFGPSPYIFDAGDAAGNTEWFLKLFDKELYSAAYQVARRVGNESLMLQPTREKMIQKSPLEALKEFQERHGQDKDAVGVSLALDALARQYGVSRETVDRYMALK